MFFIANDLRRSASEYHWHLVPGCVNLWRMAEDHIEARSITLRDSKGRPRITMDAGGDDGFATISLISNTNQQIVLSAQPTGNVLLHFDQSPFVGVLTISPEGLSLRAKDGKLGITVGRILNDVDRVIVFKDGQIAWQSPLPTSNPEPRT